MWDTLAEDKDKKLMQKKQKDAQDALSNLLQLTMAEQQNTSLMQQSFSKAPSSMQIIPFQSQQAHGRQSHNPILMTSMGGLSNIQEHQHDSVVIRDRAVHTSTSFVAGSKNKTLHAFV